MLFNKHMKNIEVIYKENLEILISEYGGVRELGEFIEKSYAQISQWRNSSKDSKTGKPRVISREMATYIERKCGKPNGWMNTDHSETNIINVDFANKSEVYAQVDSLNIPLLSATGSMGNGHDNEHADLVIDVLRITKQWADKTLSNVSKISNLRFIHAIGDSMNPTFNDGDILLVDTGVKSITSDSVYVLDAHNRLFIKRVRGRMDGTFEISSDNPSVKTVDVLNGNNQVEIKGRVVWVWNGKRV